MICGFFGHKNTNSDILPVLEQIIKDIITKNNDITFYVGNQGRFDSMVYTALKKYARIYHNFSYYVVLAYLPNNKLFNEYYDSAHTIFPEGIESIMPKYAISYRNKWLANQSDTIICYIKHEWGGAAQYVEYARKHGKTIINLVQTESLSQNTSFCERLKYCIITLIYFNCINKRHICQVDFLKIVFFHNFFAHI